jgi:hypothetical protein
MLDKQLATAGPAFTISETDARDPATYRFARDYAIEHNRVLSIEGPEGSGDLNPGGNGAGQ